MSSVSNPSDVHNPTPDDPIPSSWGDAVNDFCDDRDTGPGARATHDTTQVISDDTWVTVELNDEDYDTDSMHDPSSNNSRITVPSGKGGAYLAFFRCATTEGGGDETNIRFRVNGSSTKDRQSTGNGGTDEPFAFSILPLLAGDYVEVQIYEENTAGGSPTLSGAVFVLHRLGPST